MPVSENAGDVAGSVEYRIFLLHALDIIYRASGTMRKPLHGLTPVGFLGDSAQWDATTKELHRLELLELHDEIWVITDGGVMFLGRLKEIKIPVLESVASWE